MEEVGYPEWIRQKSHELAEELTTMEKEDGEGPTFFEVYLLLAVTKAKVAEIQLYG